MFFTHWILLLSCISVVQPYVFRGHKKLRPYCPHRTYLFKHVCDLCVTSSDVEKYAMRVSFL